MSKNSKELAVKYHGNGKLPKKKKKNPNVAEVSKMGYRDDSPYKSMPYIDIHTPNGTIDMSATGIPLWANGRILLPYSGTHKFDSKVVREIPLAQDGGDYNMERAKQLGYTPDERGHWPSVDYETGEWLKSKEHPTAWMEYLYGYTLNPQQALNYNVRTNPEGYFGDNTLQYVPKPKEQVGGSIAAKALKKALQQAKKTPIKPKSSGSAHLREMVKMKQSGVNMEDFFENLDWASAGRSLWNNIKRQGAKVLTGGQELGPDASAISAGKRKWTAKNLGLPEENVIVETQKAKYAHPNAVLIDDLPKNVQAFKDAGGKAILHETGNKQKTLKELRQVLSNTPGAQIYTDLDGVLVDLQGGVRKYNAQNSRGIRPRKQQGGWLEKYAEGGPGMPTEETKKPEKTLGDKWITSELEERINDPAYGDRAKYYSDWYKNQTIDKLKQSGITKDVIKKSVKALKDKSLDDLSKAMGFDEQVTIALETGGLKHVYPDIYKDMENQGSLNKIKDTLNQVGVSNTWDLMDSIYPSVMDLRYNLGVNPSDVITEDTLDNFYKTKGKDKSSLDRLLKIYSKPKLVEMMNTVAENKQDGTDTPVAKKGGRFNKYQTGGQPNSFDFNDLFLTDEEVTANLGQVTERRQRCIDSGAKGCLGNANAYYNIYVAPTLNAPSSWKELDGAGVISSPENTVDSWDVHGLDNRLVLYNKNDKKQGKMKPEIDWKQLNLPIGAIVGFGEHALRVGLKDPNAALNSKKGLPLAGHSGRVVGYDKNTGEPFIFDTVNNLKRISQNGYDPITVISVDKRVSGNTYDKISSGELSYKGDYDDIEITFPKNLEHDPDEFIPFIDALTKNKSKYANAIGINNNEYNEFVKRAVALSISETGGGNDWTAPAKNIPLIGRVNVPFAYTLDQMGLTGSAGITQLNKDVLKNLFNDPSTERKFKSVFGKQMNYNWFQFNNPEHVAFATLLLLKQNKRAAQSLNKRGKTNNPNFTDDDLAWYMWNQPGTILKGEAHGDNQNYKKYRNILDMISVNKPLKTKLAKKKQGGSTSKLPSHLPEAYKKGGFIKAQTGTEIKSVTNTSRSQNNGVYNEDIEDVSSMTDNGETSTQYRRQSNDPKSVPYFEYFNAPGYGNQITTAGPNGTVFSKPDPFMSSFLDKRIDSKLDEKKKGGWLNKYQTGGAAYSIPRPNVETPMTTRNSSPITLPTVEIIAKRKIPNEDLNNFLQKTLASANNQTFAALSTRAGVPPAQIKARMDAEGPIVRVWDPYTKEFKIKTSARLQQEKAERDTRGGTISPLKERSFLENVDRTINKVMNFSLRPGDYGEKDPTKMTMLDHILNPVSIGIYGIPYVGAGLGSYQAVRSLSNPGQYVPRDASGNVSIDPGDWGMAALYAGLDIMDVPGFSVPKTFNPQRPMQGMGNQIVPNTPPVTSTPPVMGGVRLSETVPPKPYTPAEIDYEQAKSVFNTKLASDTEDAIEKELYNAGIIRKNEQVRRKNPEGTSKVPKNVSDFINSNNLREEVQAIVDQLERRGYSIDFNSPVFNEPSALVRTFDKAKELMFGDTPKGQFMRSYLNQLSKNKELLNLRDEIGKVRALSMEPDVIDRIKNLPADQKQKYTNLQPKKVNTQIEYRGQPIDVEFIPTPHYDLTATRPSGHSNISRVQLLSPVPGTISKDDLHFQIDENNLLSGFGFFAARPPGSLVSAARSGDPAAKEELDKFMKQRQRASGTLMMAAMDMVPTGMMVTERTMSVDSFGSLMSVGSKSNFKIVNSIDEPGILSVGHYQNHRNTFKGKADGKWIPLATPNQLGEMSPIAKPYNNFKDVFDSGITTLAQTDPVEVASALVNGMKTQDGLLRIQNDMLDKQLKAGHITQEFYDANSTYWYADPADPSKGLSRKPPKMPMDNVQFMELDNAERKAFLPQKTPDHPFFANGSLGYNASHYQSATPEQLEAIVASKGGSRAEAFAVDSYQRTTNNQDYLYMSVYGAIADDKFIEKVTSPDLINPDGSTNYNNPAAYLQLDIRQPIPVFKKEYKKFGGQIGGRKLRKGGQNWLSKYE